MKIEFKDLGSQKRNIIDLDLSCRKGNDLSVLIEFKYLQKLQIRNFKGINLSFLKVLAKLKNLNLENVSANNELEDLGSLTALEVLTLQTPVGWDGSGKKIEYKSLKPLSGLISLTELWLLDVEIGESGFKPVLQLKNLKKIVTNNTFSTHDFAELNVFRPDIECEYAAAYRIREIEYFICKKCGAYKFEFSGNDLQKRTFCPNCNEKKVKELKLRFEEIKRKITSGNIISDSNICKSF